MTNLHHFPVRYYQCDGSNVANSPNSRRRPRLLLALVILPTKGMTTALVLPRQISYSRHRYSDPPHCTPYWHRRRKRNLFELHLCPNRDGAHPASWSTSPKSHYSPFSPTPTCGKNYLQRRMFPSPALGHERSNALFTRRLWTSTPLMMNQNSEGSGGFGKSDDKEKKRNNGNSSDRSKPQKNKTSRPLHDVAKGASTGSSSSNASVSPSGKAKRRRNNKTSNGKRKDQSTNRKGKPKNSTESVLKTDKSSIRTSDENTSLKRFKIQKQDGKGSSQQQREKQTSGDVAELADEGNDGDDAVQKRVVQLESIVSNQVAEIQNMKREIEELRKASAAFSKAIEVLREAGLQIDEEEEVVVMNDDMDKGDADLGGKEGASADRSLQPQAIFDDMEIFGIAPKSVTDAADAAGASILSAILAGKHRMLVDVRDAELTRDPALFVEFIELAILPVAAGLEGIDGDEYVRNRVKIVFPTVKELMTYRRSMALAAPEVVSLSTLGFDPVDERDKLIVAVAPSPDDTVGVKAMEKLMRRTQKHYVEPALRISQPVVVLNHHMVPLDLTEFGKFTSVYHLRLLSVQYMTGDSAPEYIAKENFMKKSKEGDNEDAVAKNNPDAGDDEGSNDRSDEVDAALEAAMTHAHQTGVHQGVTRAMVIRAYPKPWHVFVDTSPDTDADFDVAATFDVEPTQEDVNYAIVECLEGSEREDEIVAQQMQAALEAGQLERVSGMLGISPSDIVSENASKKTEAEDKGNGPLGEYDGNDWDDLYYDDWFSEDSV